MVNLFFVDFNLVIVVVIVVVSHLQASHELS